MVLLIIFIVKFWHLPFILVMTYRLTAKKQVYTDKFVKFSSEILPGNSFMKNQ